MIIAEDYFAPGMIENKKEEVEQPSNATKKVGSSAFKKKIKKVEEKSKDTADEEEPSPKKTNKQIVEEDAEMED